MIEVLASIFLGECILALTYMGYILIREDRIKVKNRKRK